MAPSATTESMSDQIMSTHEAFLASWSPALFLMAASDDTSSSTSLQTPMLALTKYTFDASNMASGGNFDAASSVLFPELYVEGFDLDGIWEQIKMGTEQCLGAFEAELTAAAAQVSSGEENEDQSVDEYCSDDETGSFSDQDMPDVDQEEDDEEEYGSELDSGEQDRMDETLVQEDSEQDSNDREVEELEEGSKRNVSDLFGLPTRQKSARPSVVDDDFFSLEAMERFADKFEQKDMAAAERDVDEDEEGDSEAELRDIMHDQVQRQGEDDDDSEKEDSEGDGLEGDEITYEDFFGPRKSSDDDHHRNPARRFLDSADAFHSEHQDKSMVSGEHQDPNEKEEEFEERMNDAQDPSAKNMLADEEETAGHEDLSPFERSQLKISKQIAALEEDAINPKPWTLSGEVGAGARPVNSLLEESLEIEHASKPVPVITEETTATLEDMIKARIKDKLFDDVQRRTAPKEHQYDPNKARAVLDEKSSKSLAEEYESEYLRQTVGNQVTEKDEALAKRHEELDGLLDALFTNLDALCNAHFTPKIVSFEVETTTPAVNVPAISMEEVIPAAVSEAALATAKEVYDGNVEKSQAEMEASDKKRLRTASKAVAKRKHVEREKAKQELEARYGESVNSRKEKALKSLSSQQNVTIISDAKSKRMLAGPQGGMGKKRRGQPDVQANVIEKGGKLGEKRDKATLSGVKLKL